MHDFPTSLHETIILANLLECRGCRLGIAAGNGSPGRLKATPENYLEEANRGRGGRPPLRGNFQFLALDILRQYASSVCSTTTARLCLSGFVVSSLLLTCTAL